MYLYNVQRNGHICAFIQYDLCTVSIIVDNKHTRCTKLLRECEFKDCLQHNQRRHDSIFLLVFYTLVPDVGQAWSDNKICILSQELINDPAWSAQTGDHALILLLIKTARQCTLSPLFQGLAAQAFTLCLFSILIIFQC